MAVLAVAAVAAVAAGSVAAAAGATLVASLAIASIGFSVGTMLGNALFPVTTNTTGPRLNDLHVTSSTFGSVIPFGAGTFRTGGNLIWAAPLREQANQQGGGKGSMFGGGKGNSATTYSYYGSFAVGIAEGEASKVLRIWADSNLVYDVTGASAVVQKAGFNFRFYSGSETQLPDSIIEAHEGVGNVPAFRGLCYVVCDDIPLIDYANRLPTLNFELSYSAAPHETATPFTMMSTSLNALTGVSDMYADWTRGYIWVLHRGLVPYISRLNIATMAEDRQKLISDIITVPTLTSWSVGSLLVDQDGFLYFRSGGQNTDPIVQVDPNTLTETGRFGPESASLANTSSGFVETAASALVSLYSTTGRVDYMLTVSIFDNIGLLTLPEMLYAWSLNLGNGIFDLRGQGVVGGRVELGYGEGWVCFTDPYTPKCKLVQVRVTSASLTPDVAYTEIDFVATEFDATATSVTGIGDMVYDASDNGVMFTTQVTIPAGQFNYRAKYIDGQGIVWSTNLNYSYANFSSANGYASSRTNGFGSGVSYTGTAYQVAAPDGTLVAAETTSYTPYGSFSIQLYDATTRSIYMATAFDTFVRVDLGRYAAAALSLGDLVAALFERVGLTSADYDVSALDSTELVGYLLTQLTAANGAIGPLAQAYQFDVVEVDGKLVCVLRGGASAATITEDLLVRSNASSGAEPYTEVRAQEVDLPSVFSVNYIDQAMNYGQNTQQSTRNRGPDPTVLSDNQVVTSLPAVVSATFAKQSSEMQLYSAWNGRRGFQSLLPPDYAWLSPSDPIVLSLNDGTSTRLRLMEANLGVDFTTEMKAPEEHSEQYTSTAVAPQVSAPVQVILVILPSALFLLDIPLLRDQDAALSTLMRGYWASSYYTSGTWPGAVLEASPDASAGSWFVDGIDFNPVVWGYTETAMPDPGTVDYTDTSGSVTVTMSQGGDTLASISDANLVAGYNAMAMIKANGEIEVLQFRDVTVLGSDRFTFSTFLRGRRGTDTMATGHAAGEAFVLLSSSTVQVLDIELSARNATQYYRAITRGQLPQQANIVAKAFTGRDLKPYAPVHVAGTIVGSDIVLTWTRRTRIGGALADGTGTVPLSEDTEAYQIDITTGGGTRTLTAVTPTVTYLAADIATDFGGMPSSLTLVVYQVSATVGVGFGRTDVIGIS